MRNAILAVDPSTWWLVAVTGLLAVVTGWMANETRKAAQAAASAAQSATDEIEQNRDLIEIGQAQVSEAQKQVGAARDQVDASLKQADASMAQSAFARRTLEALSEPLIIPTTELEPVEPNKTRTFRVGQAEIPGIQDFPVSKIVRNDAGGWFILRLRNVGSGPAVFGQNRADVFLQHLAGATVYGELQSRVVAAHDRTFATFYDDSAAPLSLRGIALGQSNQLFTLVLRYSDIGRERIFTTRITVNPGQGRRPEVIDVLFEEEQSGSRSL